MNYIVHYRTTAPRVFDSSSEVDYEVSNRTDVSRVTFNGEDVTFQFFTSDGLKKTENVGQKYSQNKLDMSKLFVQFPHACQAIVLASTFGNAKYHKTDDPETWDNFKKVPNGYNQFKSAEFRHELLTQEEEESGLHPEFHILWNSLARYEHWAMQNGVKESELAEKHIKNWYEKYGVNKN